MTLNETHKLPLGRIDIHSHLLPGIDDGCLDFAESLKVVRCLRQHGYVGTICTPHIWPERFPRNTPQQIEGWTFQLSDQLRDAGVDFQIWPGGELRIFDNAVDWMKGHGVPTLAGSRFVLSDFFLEKWPKWVLGTYEWLLANHYRPILAHPERLPPSKDSARNLPRLVEMGVWLQGNFRSFTGEDGYFADRQARQFMVEKRYHFLGLDMHRLESLETRLDGMQLMVEEFGADQLDELTIHAPRRHILGVAESM